MTETRLIAKSIMDHDIEMMAASMRSEDVDECIAFGFTDTKSAICESVKLSYDSFVVHDVRGELVALFGLSLCEDSKFAKPWMVCTTEISKHPVSAIKIAREVTCHWSDAVSLYNFVHEDSTSAIDFIEAVGFEIDPEKREMPATGDLFYLFWKGDKPCVS